MKNTKLVFVLLFAVLGVVGLTTNDHFVQTVGSFSSGPPAGFSGAPGENNCTACHFAEPQTGQFAIIAPSSYVPGQTYQIQVVHTTGDPSRLRWGFQLTALDPAFNAAGTFANLSQNTQTLNENGRFYIEHTTAGTFQNQSGGAMWSFNWTAPGQDVGQVTLYAAGNQANNDSSTSGDQIYNTSASAATPVTVPVSSFAVLQGRSVVGGLAELAASDNTYLSILQNPFRARTTPAVQVQFEAFAQENTPSSIAFRIEANTSAVPPGNVTQRLELFNFNTGQWTIISETPATGTDSVRTGTVNTAASDYREAGTGRVRARANWFDPGTLVTRAWRVNIDQALFIISP